MPRITHTPEADKDISQIATDLANENMDVAIRFLEAVRETEIRMLDLPHTGVLRSYGNPRLTGMRMVPVNDFKNHLIFYMPTNEGILIVRILHGARDIENLFG